MISLKGFLDIKDGIGLNLKQVLWGSQSEHQTAIVITTVWQSPFKGFIDISGWNYTRTTYKYRMKVLALYFGPAGSACITSGCHRLELKPKVLALYFGPAGSACITSGCHRLELKPKTLVSYFGSLLQGLVSMESSSFYRAKVLSIHNNGCRESVDLWDYYPWIATKIR